MSPVQIWCNEAQERYVLAIPPAQLDRFKAICERERCPYAVVGTATADGRLHRRRSGVQQRAGRNGARRCSASRQRCCATSRRVPTHGRIRCAEIDTARCRAARAATAGGGRQDVLDFHRRPHRRRQQRARPDGGPVAGAGGRLRGDARRSHATSAKRWRWASARRSRSSMGRLGPHGGGRGGHNIMAAPDRRHPDVSSRPTGWRRPGTRARTRRSSTRCAPWAWSFARARHRIPVGKDSMSMKTTWKDGGTEQSRDRAPVARGLGLCAGRRCARH